jgi:diaminohydroxyphosphoribosylaminopyrimidine deaminase/5-amino-6-(5-phosphoribosylamino)uracil reductase
VTREQAMRLALAQARRASGRTFPNPPVGAVVVRGDRVLGRGSTHPVGGPHAEVVAIDAAIRRHGARAVRGATLAVTLEPCSHVGRTPPCADRVIEAGVARVWIGHRDPHPEVSGRGVLRLRRAGVRVELGVLERECREQHRGFLCVLASGRPFVALKLAATLDGRIATAAGESRWITGPAAREAVHRLRRRADAIWVGAETALVDDPELVARARGRVVHRPIRLVADTRLRLLPTARMLRGAPGSTWVLCGAGAPRARRRALEAAGARVLEVAGEGDHLDLRRVLRRLGQEGLTEILVEGGGRLAAGLLRRSLVDELHWFTAPLVIGGDGRAALGELGVRALAGAPRLCDVALRRIGDDAHWTGRFESKPSGAQRAQVSRSEPRASEDHRVGERRSGESKPSGAQRAKGERRSDESKPSGAQRAKGERRSDEWAR